MIFYITIILVSFGYISQFYKIIKNKSSIGVSIEAYYVTFISVMVMTILSETNEVYMIALTELILTIYGIYIINKYKKDKLKRLDKDFYISLVLSFFMIFGVAQAIESYKDKNNITQVSIQSYLLWIMLDSMVIYMAENNMIIAALSTSISIYVYIIINTMIKNKNSKKTLDNK
jgi:O-antigen ligase